LSWNKRSLVNPWRWLIGVIALLNFFECENIFIVKYCLALIIKRQFYFYIAIVNIKILNYWRKMHFIFVLDFMTMTHDYNFVNFIIFSEYCPYWVFARICCRYLSFKVKLRLTFGAVTSNIQMCIQILI